MTYKKPEEMDPFERIEYELKLLEWQGAEWNGVMFCPSCDIHEGRRHSLNCGIRIIREQLEMLSGTVWFND
jgi:hypothetical protein